MPIAIDNTDLVYFPVPKLASSSLKSAIYEHNQTSSEKGLAHDEKRLRPYRVYPTTAFRPWYPVQYMRRRWFCVVRDPLERFLSGYVDRVEKRNDLKEVPAEILQREGLSVDPDLEEFIWKLQKYISVSPTTRHHFRPMHTYLGWFPGFYDRIFTVRQIAALIDYVGETGVMLNVPHEKRSKRKIAVADLPPAARAKIEHHYRVDYRLYGRFVN